MINKIFYAISMAFISVSCALVSKHICRTRVPRRFHSASPSVSEEDRFLFDLEGFLVVKGVFSKEEVGKANNAIDKRIDNMQERKGSVRNTKRGTTLAGDGKTGRQDLAGLLEWPSPDSDIFRAVLTHHRLLPYYHEFLGEGYRLDHLPFLINQRPGAEGFSLHGGPLDGNGEPNFYLTYTAMKDKIRTSLMGVAVQLTDVNEGDGGFCVLKGSHKANFRVPESIVHGDAAFLDRLHQPVTQAGDVVLFSEATTHGSLPWSTKNRTPRRTALFRFAPSNMAYARSYTPSWTSGMYEGLSLAQRAVLEPPYNIRLDRPLIKSDGISDDADITIESRSASKKAFDRAVFKQDYF